VEATLESESEVLYVELTPEDDRMFRTVSGVLIDSSGKPVDVVSVRLLVFKEAGDRPYMHSACCGSFRENAQFEAFYLAGTYESQDRAGTLPTWPVTLKVDYPHSRDLAVSLISIPFRLSLNQPRANCYIESATHVHEPGRAKYQM